MKHTILDPTNELTTVLAGALQISKECNLKEICTETLLYVIAENTQLTGNDKLKKLGVNVISLKNNLLKRLHAKSVQGILKTTPESTAVQGLLFLNGRKSSSLHLLATIVKYNNTAAARLLKIEKVSLNNANQLIYKPILS